LALGPHCASVEQAPQVPLLHTSPAGQFAFDVQPVIGGMQLFPVHARHARYGWQFPPPDCCVLAQYCPSTQEELDLHGPPKNGGNGKPLATPVHV
jgi:hypothetical protein